MTKGGSKISKNWWRPLWMAPYRKSCFIHFSMLHCYAAQRRCSRGKGVCVWVSIFVLASNLKVFKSIDYSWLTSWFDLMKFGTNWTRSETTRLPVRLLTRVFLDYFVKKNFYLNWFLNVLYYEKFFSSDAARFRMIFLMPLIFIAF